MVTKRSMATTQSRMAVRWLLHRRLTLSRRLFRTMMTSGHRGTRQKGTGKWGPDDEDESPLPPSQTPDEFVRSHIEFIAIR